MEDTEANNIDSETLQTQFTTVQQKTSKSPVQKFGEFDYMTEPVGEF